ncbi:MAG TPA: hypothetical protein VFR38_02475 [Gaiellaceae bacterium]|nr:hypothetical protein [Gaiellaceae bacterium]
MESAPLAVIGLLAAAASLLAYGLIVGGAWLRGANGAFQVRRLAASPDRKPR